MNRNEALDRQFLGFLQHRRNIVSDTDDTLPIVEETATIRKREVTTGRVSIRTETRLEEALAEASLSREQVEVTRVPVDREIPEPPPIRTEGDVTIIPVLEERLVVEKRLVLVEEIRVRRTTHSDEV